MRNMLKDVKHVRVLNRNAGTPGTVKGSVLDVQGFDAVRFTVGFQTVVNAALVTFRIAHGDTNDTNDMAASTAALAAITSDGTDVALSNKELVIDVIAPTERYLEAQVVIADQNAPIDYIVADLYRADQAPVSQGSSVQSSAVKVNPVNA